MSNVDAAEIAKFSELAHRWWDPNSEFKPLHEINPLRLKWIDQQAPLAGKKVLDVGCGGGILAEAMAAAGATVSGIDLSDKALKVAKLHLYESGHSVDYQLVSAEDFAAQHAGEFDVVTCMEMLEHVPDPASVVAACAQTGQAGRLGVLFDAQPQRQKLSVRRRRRRIHPQAAAARHPRLRQVHPARRTRPHGARGRTRYAGTDRHDLQPADQGLQAGSRYRRQLPAGDAAWGYENHEARWHPRRAVRPRRHPGRHRARPRLRAQPATGAPRPAAAGRRRHPPAGLARRARPARRRLRPASGRRAVCAHARGIPPAVRRQHLPPLAALRRHSRTAGCARAAAA